jgi:uncharacterized membrane protein (UPF0127 family)
MALRNERTGLLVAATLEPAFDSASRKRGLLGRDGIPASYAVVIAPSNMVHTFSMRFPIDIVIANRDGVVVKAVPGVPRRRIVAGWGGFAVLEMTAGRIDASETRRGHRLLLEPAADSEAKVSL